MQTVLGAVEVLLSLGHIVLDESHHDSGQQVQQPIEETVEHVGQQHKPCEVGDASDEHFD